MLTLEREIQALRPLLGDRVADTLIARERREVFSIDGELRLFGWLGATLIAAAAGLLLKNNLDRIGPLALSIGIALAAVVCYAFVWIRRGRATAVDDYILLLGALLLSADLAFVETQFKLLGDVWHRHFILAALLHCIGAYAYRSRALLTLSLAAIAAWFGIEGKRIDLIFGGEGFEYAVRAWTCAAVVFAWRTVDRRSEAKPSFSSVFEHFIANLLLVGSAALYGSDWTRAIGALLTIGLATAVIWWGFRQRSESFALYAFLYGVVAVNVLLFELTGGAFMAIAMLSTLGSLIIAIAGLFVIHAKFRELR